MGKRFTKWAGVCAAGAILSVSACTFDDLLKVENAEEIQVALLDDPALLEVRLSGVIDEFNEAYVDQVIRYATFLTDEMVTGLNWEDYARVNERIVSYLEGPTANIFENLSEGIRLGDGLAEHIRGWAAEDPETDFDPALATSLIYAGYSTLVLAENMCQAVISPDPDEPSGDVLSQSETYAIALPYLEEGLSVAQGAGEPELANLALTGLARANLGIGNWADAASYANQVTAGFVQWIEFVDVPNGRNVLQGTSHGGNFTHGIHPSFMGAHPSFDGTGFAFRDDDIIDPQTDPRIQHVPDQDTGHNGLTPLYKFIQGLRYSDYTGETISAVCANCDGADPDDMPLLTEFDTDVMMADYLEAQHHYHEALAMQGGSEATILTFVNARRAVGNQDPVNLTGQALINELRNQRARDLFMGGFRLPDLRRWTIHDPGNGPFDGGSYFPTGNHPNFPVWGVYQNWTCFPIPLSEYEGNPNLSAPADPNVPPAI
jgi:hypothetical protein